MLFRSVGVRLVHGCWEEKGFKLSCHCVYTTHPGNKLNELGDTPAWDFRLVFSRDPGFSWLRKSPDETHAHPIVVLCSCHTLVSSPCPIYTLYTKLANAQVSCNSVSGLSKKNSLSRVLTIFHSRDSWHLKMLIQQYLDSTFWVKG